MDSSYTMEQEELIFHAYENVRRSGLTNMFDVQAVSELADEYMNVTLERADILYCQKNFGRLHQRHMDTFEEAI